MALSMPSVAASALISALDWWEEEGLVQQFVRSGLQLRSWLRILHRSRILEMHSESGQTSFRDRTQEFLTVAERLRKSFSSEPNEQSRNAGLKLEGKSAVSIHSEFNKRASRISLGIHQTSQKLVKLAKMAKRTSVFDDPTVEIQELTAVIKQDILNSAVVDLQLLRNTQNDNGNISSDTTSHSTTVVDNLKNHLMSTTKEFKEILTMRTENLKVHDNRR